MKHRILYLTLFTSALLMADGADVRSANLTVRTDRPGAALNPGMWGIFFEDINFGADGGLYAELVKNRGFEFPERAQAYRLPV